MTYNLTTRILFLVLLVVVLSSAFQVIAPFLAGLTWASVFVAAFRPWHWRLRRALGRDWMATTLLTVLLAGFVVVPLVFATIQALQAGTAAIHWIQQAYQTGGSDFHVNEHWPWLMPELERAKAALGLADVDLRNKGLAFLASVASAIVARGPAVVGGALGIAFSFVVMLIAMPAFFANGERWSQAFIDALPLPASDARRMIWR